MVNRVSSTDIAQADVVVRGAADFEVDGQTLSRESLPEDSHVSLSKQEDGSFNLELRVPRGEDQPAIVYTKHFDNEAAVRAWANNDSEALDIKKGDPEHNAFERLRHSIDITGTGSRMRFSGVDTDGAFGEQAKTTATFLVAGRTNAPGGMVGINQRRQDTLIELGFLDKTYRGHSNSDGLNGERTRTAVDKVLDWACSEPIVSREDITSSQASTDRFVQFAGNMQKTVREYLADPANDRLLLDCGLTQDDIDRYRDNPNSFMIRDHVVLMRNLWSWSEGCTNSVRDALSARPASPEQRHFLTAVAVDADYPVRNISNYVFGPEDVYALRRLASR